MDESEGWCIRTGSEAREYRSVVGEPHDVTEPTQRGDRARRRRDVLAAAAEVLREQDWEDFSIREVASRVGVSPGAVYLWFSGKEDIIAHLQAAQLREHAAAVRALPVDTAPLTMAAQLTAMLARMHAEIGRHGVEVDSEGLGGAAELRAALHDTNESIHEKLSAVLDADGWFVPDLRARLAWLWACAQGIGDHLVDHRHDIHGVDDESFLRVAGERTAAGLLAGEAVPSWTEGQNTDE